MKLIIVDTNVIIGILRKQIEQETYAQKLSGRTPGISIVTAHELRRGAKATSPFLAKVTLPPFNLIHDVTHADWIAAADAIRVHYWGRFKGAELVKQQNDSLIATSALRLGAELWTLDKELINFCKLIGVSTA